MKEVIDSLFRFLKILIFWTILFLFLLSQGWVRCDVVVNRGKIEQDVQTIINS